MNADPTSRSYAPITLAHLARMAELAAVNCQQFYAAQPDFEGYHLATVLAQGGGLHWITGTIHLRVKVRGSLCRSQGIEPPQLVVGQAQGGRRDVGT